MGGGGGAAGPARPPRRPDPARPAASRRAATMSSTQFNKGPSYGLSAEVRNRVSAGRAVPAGRGRRGSAGRAARTPRRTPLRGAGGGREPRESGPTPAPAPALSVATAVRSARGARPRLPHLPRAARSAVRLPPTAGAGASDGFPQPCPIRTPSLPQPHGAGPLQGGEDLTLRV